jgi:hypothetical protein
MFGTRNEILERVLLVFEFAGEVPWTAAVASASNVCDGVYNSAIEKREALWVP